MININKVLGDNPKESARKKHDEKTITQSELYEKIPKDQLYKFRGDLVEIDHTFMAFLESYEPIAELVPKDFTIIDFGCYMAAQSFLFEDFNKYIGVDNFENYYPFKTDQEDIQSTPDRFISKNSKHFIMDIGEFLDKYSNELKKNSDKVYAICSFVPGYESFFDKITETFPNCLITYCDYIFSQGLESEEIEKRYEEMWENEYGDTSTQIYFCKKSWFQK